MNPLYLGIDPGKLGGWAIITADSEPIAWGKFKDWEEIKRYVTFTESQVFRISHCCLEKVGLWHSDKGQGKDFRIAKMSENLGFWKEILKSWGVAYELVAPMSWKAYFGLTKRKGRVPVTLYEYSKRRWPEIIKFKNQDGIAVGLLLAELARCKAIIKGDL